MKMRVTITDLTRMQDDKVCVAGYLPDMRCIRPVVAFGRLHEWWLLSAGTVVVRPFAVVEFDVQQRIGQAPHTEDRVIDPHYRVNKGLLTSEERLRVLEQLDDGCVATIFRAPIHHDEGWYVMAGEGSRSLGTVRAGAIDEISLSARAPGKWACRLAFRDSTGQPYRLAVTDLACRYCLSYLQEQRGRSLHETASLVTRVLQQRQVFLRIGLTRGWDRHPDRCYLQVTGIYSFPDYLHGRCFADLMPAGVASANAAMSPEPLPF